MKIKYLEFIIRELIKWYKNEDPVEGETINEIEKLKVMLMVFFISIVNVTEEDLDLLTLFDNFSAGPYGPMEMDLYSDLETMSHFKINRATEVINLDIDETVLDEFKIKQILNAIEKLKQIDPNFINKSSWEMVLISHKYYSVRYHFEKYKNMCSGCIPKYGLKIPVDFIKYDTHYFN